MTIVFDPRAATDPARLTRISSSVSMQPLAFDRGSARSYDLDGRLHVSTANISKAAVNPYFGSEIPDWRSLGLDPARPYQLLRPANELAKAAPSFRNLPLLSKHVPVDARDHRPDLVCGSTGTDVRFVNPYLQCSLVIWSAEAIEKVRNGEQRQLSSAYRYQVLMQPGEFKGARYDGVMINLVGNHVALVAEGRAGADVVVGDAALRRRFVDDAAKRFPHAARIRVSP